MRSKDRLLRILRRKPSDRAAVICPGGMMSMAVVEVMAREGAAWPEAHRSEESMLRLALAMQAETGFDNLALPFCMTVEAEAYGANVDVGGATTQPRVKGVVLPAGGSAELTTPDFTAGRAGTTLKAMAKARSLRPDLALVGNLVGPMSVLGMLADPLQMLRWTSKRPHILQEYLERVSEQLIEFGKLQREAGADLVCIAEPTATGEILGGERFRLFAQPYLNKIAKALRKAGLSVIVHICGDVSAIEKELFELAADAVSFDSMADIVAIARQGPPWQVMGNISAFLLEAGPSEAIQQTCRRLLEGGVRLLAPACGVIPTTPVAHLRAMRDSIT